MSDHASRLPEVSVCRDARETINDGLRRLAQHIKRPEGVLPTIVDSLVDNVTQARARAQEFYERGLASDNDKLLLVAAKYDEMIINADIRMLELGVKAANQEQQAIDRQKHIDAYRAVKSADVAPALEVSAKELEKLQQRAQLLAAAQQTSRTTDAQFTKQQPFSDSQ
jgi:hypothetical protein